MEHIIKNNLLIRYIKAQILSWFGHIKRFTSERMIEKLYKRSKISTRPKRKPNISWENYIVMKVNGIVCVEKRKSVLYSYAGEVSKSKYIFV